MGRLIDADALIEFLQRKRKTLLGIGGNKYAIKAFDYIIARIAEQPTAYDVEKVVAELEEEHENADGEYKKSFELYREEFWRGRKGGLRKAITIVRKGGIDG